MTRLFPDLNLPFLARDSAHMRFVVTTALILLWTCMVRLPFLHIVNDDEAFFSVMGTRWLQGDLPYVDSYDVKPPLLFALFAIAQAIFGLSLATIKGLEIVFTAGGALLLYKLVQRHGSERVARWCAFLFPVYSLTLTGACEPNSVLQLPFIIMAFYALLNAQADAKPARRLLAADLRSPEPYRNALSCLSDHGLCGLVFRQRSGCHSPAFDVCLLRRHAHSALADPGRRLCAAWY
jgi:hypothetical protein